jgi:hypothetical protein
MTLNSHSECAKLPLHALQTSPIDAECIFTARTGGIQMNDLSNRPVPAQLTSAQRECLRPFLARFKDYAKTEKFAKDQKERNEQLNYFHNELPARLSGFAESDVLDIVTRLWASRIWGNKQYLALKIVSENGLDVLRDGLSKLLNNALPVTERYDDFREHISHLGPAAVTEIMCYSEPSRCGIWNGMARRALKILQLGDQINPDLYQISGRQYETFNSLLAAIADEISKKVLSSVDLLQVDYFLYEVAQEVLPSEKIAVAPVDANTHEEIQDLIEAIGSMLGFETDKEVLISHGAKVDVVWRARIGNLGRVTYVFEVQSLGSIDSLILNLQRSRNDPTVQKVIAVSDEQQLQRIQREVEALPSEFRKSLGFWNVSEVRLVSENLQSAMAIINKLGLTPGKT